MEKSSFKEPSNFLTDEKPIKTTGTTCDAFSARYESRHVFVKRLKPEHASNSKYRWAFQKEYELGVSLRHPSIPQYIKFTGDTLITEFVDGKTLHQMIQDDDLRLHSDRNIEKWVGQLLDVMDYLHARNMIHCDIKTDNIMITNDTRNLMLIDFDKAFTASQDLTPGTPLNYGTEDENLTTRQMDVRGVRNIVEKLVQYVGAKSLKKQLEKFVVAAVSPEVTIPELMEIWENRDTGQNKVKRFIGLSLGAIILISLLVIVWSYLPKEPQEVIPHEDTYKVENSEITIPQEELEISNLEERNEGKKLSSPNWDSLLTTDVAPINKLLDKITSEIQTDKINADSVQGVVLLINNEMNIFNTHVLEKYSMIYPELSQDKIMTGIYESKPITKMVKRRDEILQRLIEIQQ